MKPVATKTVDAYIRSFDSPVKEKLEQMRALIRKAAPGAEEIISYKMPAYRYNGMLVYFAGYKRHIGFYAVPGANVKFKKELEGYETSKGSIRFPLDKKLPSTLITKIVKFRVKENANR
jgi:uncharacterized protein YdhG (YjbR/CyaY superfamily)